jgi:hypothetical protein
MTEQELRLKWPREEFEEWKARGIFGETATYEFYLDFRREQLTEYYGEPPNEQPPELTEEDHRLLSEAWAEVARERQLQEAERICWVRPPAMSRSS